MDVTSMREGMQKQPRRSAELVSVSHNTSPLKDFSVAMLNGMGGVRLNNLCFVGSRITSLLEDILLRPRNNS